MNQEVSPHLKWHSVLDGVFMFFHVFFYHHLDSKRGPKSHLDAITWLHGQAAMLLLNTSISLESSQRSVGSVVGADGLRVPNIKVRFTLKERTWKEMRDGKECLNKNTIETQQCMKLIDWRFLQRITWLLLLLSSAPGVPQHCSTGPQESWEKEWHDGLAWREVNSTRK